MNTEQARENMIKQQLRTWNVSDSPVLDLLANTPREQFVPDEYKKLAFADTSIPLMHNQSMMPPKEEGHLLQAMNVQATEKVLLIGVESGYIAATLGKLAAHVYVVDNHADMITHAETQTKALNLNNISYLQGNINDGWNQFSPFDVIVLTGSVPHIPDSLRHHLNIGGRLYAVVGHAPAMSATVLHHDSETQWREQILFETVRPRIAQIEETDLFEF